MKTYNLFRVGFYIETIQSNSKKFNKNFCMDGSCIFIFRVVWVNLMKVDKLLVFCSNKKHKQNKKLYNWLDCESLYPKQKLKDFLRGEEVWL